MCKHLFTPIIAKVLCCYTTFSSWRMGKEDDCADHPRRLFDHISLPYWSSNWCWSSLLRSPRTLQWTSLSCIRENYWSGSHKPSPYSRRSREVDGLEKKNLLSCGYIQVQMPTELLLRTNSVHRPSCSAYVMSLSTLGIKWQQTSCKYGEHIIVILLITRAMLMMMLTGCQHLW